ncbi:MAG: peptide ABC transporter substrate-binding protein [Chloroflexi bacterium]|nr:peptide ABC transporter substrate-binding protein [Chloroflexota bacterium]
MKKRLNLRSPFGSLVLLGTVLLLFLGCRLFEGALQSGVANLEGIDRETAVSLSGSQPRTLDPATTLGGPSGPLGHIFNGLTTLDTNLQVQPELAAGWTVSEDGLTYTFYLRKDALFHNGRSVTAQDVIFSWERAADPATGSDTVQTYLGDIAGVEEKLNGRSDQISGLRSIDEHTLEVRLTAPVVYFLAKLAYPVGYVVDQENVRQSDWEHQPNGSGPFRLMSWEDDQLLILARNEQYFGQVAQIEHVVYDLGPNLPLSQYETGEIDLVGIGGPTLERARDPNSPFADQLQTGVGMCTTTIGLNNQLPPFDDVRVRQAFNYALDKELMVDAFANGNGLVATGSLPPGMPGFTGQTSGYPFNLEKARQLLADAGYENLADFPILTYSTSGYGDAGGYVTAVITQWQQNLGVTIQPQVIEPYQFYDELYAGNVGHIYSSGWCADYPDPQNFLDILYHSQSRQNVGGYANPTIDTMLEQARIERDINTRLALYADIERDIVADAPVVFVSHGLTAVLVSPDLQNYILTPIGVRQWNHVSISR